MALWCECLSVSVANAVGPNIRTSSATMKLLTEYLDRAVGLERLAAGEENSTFKTQLLDQAAAYRTLAAKRAEDFGFPPPSPPEIVEAGLTAKRKRPQPR